MQPDPSASRIPFFIVGMGRTGSTFLYHLLQAHPSIALTNESRVFDFFYFMYRTASLGEGEEEPSDVYGVDRLQGIMTPPHNLAFREALIGPVKAAIGEFYSRTFEGKDWTHYGDKLPGIHAAMAWRILEPETRYIEIQRDPRDVVVSVRKVKWPQDLDSTCELWCSMYENARQLERHTVRYEELIRDPLAIAQGALRHLGLEMHDACAEALAANTTFSSHGTSQTPEASIGRWAGELTDDEIARIEDRCGDLMREQGYL